MPISESEFFDIFFAFLQKLKINPGQIKIDDYYEAIKDLPDNDIKQQLNNKYWSRLPKPDELKRQLKRRHDPGAHKKTTKEINPGEKKQECYYQYATRIINNHIENELQDYRYWDYFDSLTRKETINAIFKEEIGKTAKLIPFEEWKKYSLE